MESFRANQFTIFVSQYKHLRHTMFQCDPIDHLHWLDVHTLISYKSLVSKQNSSVETIPTGKIPLVSAHLFQILFAFNQKQHVLWHNIYDLSGCQFFKQLHLYIITDSYCRL